MPAWADKFELRTDTIAFAIDAPSEELEVLRAGAPAGAKLLEGPPKAGQVQLLFYWPAKLDGLDTRFQALRERLADTGSLWAVFPKKAHRGAFGVDMTWDQMQAAALTTDLVDVKVASFSSRTYGTKFVIRRSARGSADRQSP